VNDAARPDHAVASRPARADAARLRVADTARHPATDAARLAEADATLGHSFHRPDLLREALTHRSAAHGTASGRMRPGQKGQGSNERLEFIGDRVLGLLVAEWLAERFPDEQEGSLGPRHAQLVSRPVLAAIADAAGLSRAISVAPNEDRAGVKRLATVLADTMEAVIGAVFLDAGLDAARILVRRCWADAMTAQILPPKDPKTTLQEYLLGRGRALPVYEVASREGPSHNPSFVITVTAAGQTGTGTAGSKRIAERDAALDLLAKLA
jgi:ribonuclease-3